MFFRILKKDLKRKKSMNIIMLIFVILSTMFAAASVNNIMAVTSGVENYFELSGVPDAVVSENYDSKHEKEISELDGVTSVKTEHMQCIFTAKDFSHEGVHMNNFINPVFVLSDDEMPVKYFDNDNNVIKSVEKGTFYSTSVFTKDLGAKVGDTFEIDSDNVHITLKYMGRLKGALIQEAESSCPFILLNSEDFDVVDKAYGVNNFNRKTLYINTDNFDALTEFTKEHEDMYGLHSRESEKDIYLFDMLAAYIMMMISVVIMLASFVVLRFTIGFTIQEEFREIGVMKAVGVSNGSIRRIYIVKYFALAVAGAFIGFFASIPLSNMMLATVSKNMVLSSENSLLINIMSAAGIVGMIVVFCYLCTRRVNKLSPIDAVRSGQTGERFRKKSIMHLGRSKLPTTGFLAVNDISSAPKQFLIITVVFTLCMLMMTLMSTFADTLKSEKLFRSFGAQESHISIIDSHLYAPLCFENDGYKKVFEDVEKMLDDTGIKAKYSTTFGDAFETEYKDKKSTRIMYGITKGNINDDIICDEGSAPQKADEIVLTGYAMNELGAGIGDTIKAHIGSKDYEFIITGKVSSFWNNGRAAFLYKDFDSSEILAQSLTGVQLRLDGEPDDDEIKADIKKLKEYLDSDQVCTNGDAVKMMTQMSDTLNAIKKMMMIITVIVTALIVVLMERSFISREKSEIALMKAVGVQGRSITFQHMFRFVIVAVLACIVSSALILPLSNVMMGWICSMIGDISNVSVDFRPAEVFAVCPAILIGVAVIGSFLTSLYNKTIVASDTASIE
jgi:putative ABC transport system permease protein